MVWDGNASDMINHFADSAPLRPDTNADTHFIGKISIDVFALEIYYEPLFVKQRAPKDENVKHGQLDSFAIIGMTNFIWAAAVSV